MRTAGPACRRWRPERILPGEVASQVDDRRLGRVITGLRLRDVDDLAALKGGDDQVVGALALEHLSSSPCTVALVTTAAARSGRDESVNSPAQAQPFFLDGGQHSQDTVKVDIHELVPFFYGRVHNLHPYRPNPSWPQRRRGVQSPRRPRRQSSARLRTRWCRTGTPRSSDPSFPLVHRPCGWLPCLSCIRWRWRLPPLPLPLRRQSRCRHRHR